VLYLALASPVVALCFPLLMSAYERWTMDQEAAVRHDR
jgi:hypothetical protein